MGLRPHSSMTPQLKRSRPAPRTAAAAVEGCQVRICVPHDREGKDYVFTEYPKR